MEYNITNKPQQQTTQQLSHDSKQQPNRDSGCRQTMRTVVSKVRVIRIDKLTQVSGISLAGKTVVKIVTSVFGINSGSEKNGSRKFKKTDTSHETQVPQDDFFLIIFCQMILSFLSLFGGGLKDSMSVDLSHPLHKKKL